MFWTGINQSHQMFRFATSSIIRYENYVYQYSRFPAMFGECSSIGSGGNPFNTIMYNKIYTCAILLLNEYTSVILLINQVFNYIVIYGFPCDIYQFSFCLFSVTERRKIETLRLPTYEPRAIKNLIITHQKLTLKFVQENKMYF